MAKQLLISTHHAGSAAARQRHLSPRRLGLSQAAFKHQANGNLITNAAGNVSNTYGASVEGNTATYC